jgi:uncharacterized damage-inducible protein DinB
MEIPIGFGRLLAHDHWANGEALRSLEALPSPPAKGLELMGHLMGAEVSWLLRMTEGRDPDDWEAWEKADVPWLRRAWSEVLPDRWAAFLGNPVLSDPARTFSYVNYLGEAREARVEDVVTQLMLHSAYHRGQVGTAVRAAGGTPAVVDFLHAARNGLLPGPKAPRVDR